MDRILDNRRKRLKASSPLPFINENTQEKTIFDFGKKLTYDVSTQFDAPGINSFTQTDEVLVEGKTPFFNLKNLINNFV